MSYGGYMELLGAFAQADQIVEKMYFSSSAETFKLLISKENRELIRELKELADVMPWLSYQVIGVAQSKKWFVMQSNLQGVEGKVIYVNFKQARAV